MPVLVQEYDRSLRPRSESLYVRKPAKIVRCRNEQAHVCSFPRKSAIHSRWHTHQSIFTDWFAKTEVAATFRQLADANALTTDVEAKFRKLATEWLGEVGSVSSLEALTSHPKYREIIRLGWEVVPSLLADLQQNRGYWFTALNEITGIRPFDPSDAGKTKRMTEAWINWGKRRGII